MTGLLKMANTKIEMLFSLKGAYSATATSQTNIDINTSYNQTDGVNRDSLLLIMGATVNLCFKMAK